MYSRYILSNILFLFSIIATSQEETKNPFSIEWKHGFKLSSEDEDFILKFGGRIMIDHAYFFQNNSLTENYEPLISKSGTEIRRARMYFEGSIYKNTFFKIDADFAGDEVELKNVFIEFGTIPGVGNIRIGHFKEPLSLSSVNSSKYSTFMEVAQNTRFFQTRNNGIMMYNSFLDEQLSAQFAVYRNADNDSNDVLADDGYVLTGRITGLPYRNKNKKQLLHLGMGYSYRKPESKKYQISANPGSHLAPKYLNTGKIEDVEEINLINFETAYITGPFSVQAEYINASLISNPNNLNFSNYYAEVSYFITGESKNYKNSYDGFGRIKPNKNFNGKDGLGALEIALRYSETDLTDKNIFGGEQSDFALGLNWYLNPVTRIMLNYIRADIENLGQSNIIQGRVQVDF